MNADSADTARSAGGISRRIVSEPVSSSVVGRTRRPPLARVAKAVVVSRSVTSEVPSASEGTAASRLSIPAACATRTTWRMPTACATSAAGTLRSPPGRGGIVTGPWNWPSMLWGAQSPPAAGMTTGSSDTTLAAVSRSPRDSKAAR